MALAVSSSSQSHVERFIYNDETARFELVRLIAQLDLPLNTCEQPAWGEYIRNSFYPSYRPVSRKSTTRDMETFYSLRQYVVIDFLNQATCVCLTLTHGMVILRRTILVWCFILSALIGNYRNALSVSDWTTDVPLC